MPRRFPVFALLGILAGCASENPAAVDITGTWEGSYVHPTVPGTLTLTITGTDADFEGVYLLSYPSGLGAVQNITGAVAGTRPTSGSILFTIPAVGGDWTFVGQLTTANRIQGTWSPAGDPGTEHQFELQRE